MLSLIILYFHFESRIVILKKTNYNIVQTNWVIDNNMFNDANDRNVHACLK